MAPCRLRSLKPVSRNAPRDGWYFAVSVMELFSTTQARERAWKRGFNDRQSWHRSHRCCASIQSFGATRAESIGSR